MSANAGSKTKIPVEEHGLTTSDRIRPQATYNYDGEVTINSIPDRNHVVINKAYAAEKFTGSEKIYVGLREGCNISMPHIANGTYRGIMPDTIKKMLESTSFRVFVTITNGGYKVTLEKTWESVFYEGEST